MIETTDLDKTPEKKWGVNPEESLEGNLRTEGKEVTNETERAAQEVGGKA